MRHGSLGISTNGSTARAGLIAAMLLAAACATEVPETDPIRPVRTQPVFSAGGTRVRTLSGTARAGVESRLSFRVAGSLRKLQANVGESVRAGQVLAELDPKDYELRVEDAEAALAQARARERNARANLERVRGLFEDNNASRNDYDAARAEHESSSAQVDSLDKKTELARLQLDYTRLRSPVDGAISRVEVEVNENVSPGQTVAVLTSGARTEVRVSVPEVFISHIREGQEVTVSFDVLNGGPLGAVVTEVGVASTGLSTTFPVTVRLTEAAPGVLPGMAAEVAFRIESRGGTDRILVPPFAVGEDREGRHVFVAEPGEGGLATARRRPVQVGDLTGSGLEVLDGLDEGELLITAGVSRLEDGMQVRLEQEAPESDTP